MCFLRPHRPVGPRTGRVLFTMSGDTSAPARARPRTDMSPSGSCRTGRASSASAGRTVLRVSRARGAVAAQVWERRITGTHARRFDGSGVHPGKRNIRRTAGGGGRGAASPRPAAGTGVQPGQPDRYGGGPPAPGSRSFGRAGAGARDPAAIRRPHPCGAGCQPARGDPCRRSTGFPWPVGFAIGRCPDDRSDTRGMRRGRCAISSKIAGRSCGGQWASVCGAD